MPTHWWDLAKCYVTQTVILLGFNMANGQTHSYIHQRGDVEKHEPENSELAKCC